MSQPATVRRTASTANVLPVLVSTAGQPSSRRFGTGTDLMTRSSRSMEVTPASSASGDTIMRCPSTKGTTAFTSSAVTNGRLSAAA